VIQGYNGVAAVDSKHQVVVAAESFGSGQEHGLLEPMLEQVATNLKDDGILKTTKVLADSGYSNIKTLTHLEEQGIDSYIADHGFRSRDPRFATADRHKANEPPRLKPRKGRYSVADFSVDIEQKSCICPAGKSLWLKCEKAKIDHRIFMQFMGHQADCDSCPQRAKCLRSTTQKGARQVNVLLQILVKEKNGPLERMRKKIDSEEGRHIYSWRLGIVEPVFGNIRETLGLRRFSLRGKAKVTGQWRLMSMLHNIFKIHRYGWV
jgi:IS5 family transposase